MASKLKKSLRDFDNRRNRIIISIIIIFIILWLLCLIPRDWLPPPDWCYAENETNATSGYWWSSKTCAPGDNVTDVPVEGGYDDGGEDIPPPPPPPPPTIDKCNQVCQGGGYDFGVFSSIVCKYPFSENIDITGGVCCCGDFVDWLNAYHIVVEDDWCFDSDLDEFDYYTYPGFCVDSSSSYGLWDACVEPLNASTDIREAICMGTSCIYSTTTCAIEGGTDDCFESSWGALCSSL